MKKLFMVCNAHIDPVWQWEWEEGVGTVLSTFRATADFCEEYDGFVFNHNEVMAYRWVEEYEPRLFARIQKLAAQGKWHIMGGWYLQPDCNMPSGESIIRQIEEGRRYFKEKFNAVPTVAINFDPFGHSRGLVQIMRQAGYTGYIVCRPTAYDMAVEDENFLWEGFNNTSITVHRSLGFYSSQMGRVDEKIQSYLDGFKGSWAHKHSRMMLWGVGNHGGRPSRKDLDRIKELRQLQSDVELIHATPEQFFEAIRHDALPRVNTDLGRCMPGCYSSQVRLKQKHRRFEQELLATEKISAHAASEGLLPYPYRELHAAQQDLLYAQFHDILPGDSTQLVEESSLRLMDHGLEELSRLKTRAYFALCEGETPAAEKEYPILIYNPHPVEVETVLEAEFMLAYAHGGEGALFPTIYQDGAVLPSQFEKETSNIPFDWRKKVVFRAKLKPMAVNRFQCFVNRTEKKDLPQIDVAQRAYTFDSGRMQVTFNLQTGYIDSWVVDDHEYFGCGACSILAMQDCEDSWGFNNFNCNAEKGRFKLASPELAASVAAVKAPFLQPVRIIGDGDVRTVVEAVYQYNRSFAVVRYQLNRQTCEIGLHIRMFNNEKDTLFKLHIPTTVRGSYLGKTAYGVNELLRNGEEVVAQEWVICQDGQNAVSCINNGTYSSSYDNGMLRPTLMRACAYCAHPVGDKTILPQDRFSERTEQGERQFEYVLSVGTQDERRVNVDFEAAVFNQRPFGVSYFPSGQGKKCSSFVKISNKAVSLVTVRQTESGDYTLRLFNPLPTAETGVLEIEASGVRGTFTLQPMEIMTLLYRNDRFEQTGLFDCV